MGGMVDRQRIREQEDWAPKELRGDVGSAKLARHEVNMCRASLCSSMSSIYRTHSYMKWQYGGVHHSAIGGNSQDIAFGVLAFHRPP